MHCLTAWGQWAVELVQCTATLPGGSGQRNSCYALPHSLWAVGNGTSAMHCLTAWGQWAVELLQCCVTASGQWTVHLVPCTATLPVGPGQWYSCNALPHCLGAVGSGTPAVHCHTALGQLAMELSQCTATLPVGSGQWNSCNAASQPRGSGQWYSCNALPHCLWVVGSGTRAMHCHTAWGQWAVEVLQCTAPLPPSSGHRSSTRP